MPKQQPKPFEKGYSAVAEKLCRLGAGDKEIASFFGVSQKVLNTWKNTYPKFAEAFVNGSLLADALVADSLFHRAIGYVANDYDVRVLDGDIKITPVKKYYPPDPTSIMFYLKNRQSTKWKDKVAEEKITEPPRKEKVIVIEPVERRKALPEL